MPTVICPESTPPVMFNRPVTTLLPERLEPIRVRLEIAPPF